MDSLSLTCARPGQRDANGSLHAAAVAVAVAASGAVASKAVHRFDHVCCCCRHHGVHRMTVQIHFLQLYRVFKHYQNVFGSFTSTYQRC
jgi:hypothetical protein